MIKRILRFLRVESRLLEVLKIELTRFAQGMARIKQESQERQVEIRQALDTKYNKLNERLNRLELACREQIHTMEHDSKEKLSEHLNR